MSEKKIFRASMVGNPGLLANQAKDLSFMMKITKNLYLYVWISVFFYILFIGLIFQLVVLPLYFPSLHAGDGLLKGGDWLYFQDLALELALKIETYGWSAWQLRPAGQAPAGIAAAVYMLTGIAKPWIILPLNAAAHATSTLMLLYIVDIITDRKSFSILPVLPFSLFPTALLWNTQFHKDGLFILGAFLVIYGLLLLDNTSSHNSIAYSISGFTAIISGVFFIWVVRPYGVEIVIYIGLFLAVVASMNILFKNRDEPKYYYKIVLIWLAFLVSFTYSTSEIYEQYVMVDYSEIILNDQKESIHLPHHDESLGSVSTAEGSAAWRKSKYLPPLIDEKVYQIAIMRERYLEHKPDASSNIDLTVRFSSAGDAIRYIPRALVIGLLAPFPPFWFNWNSSSFFALVRFSSGLEMLFSYLAIIGLLAGCWVWHKRVELYLAIVFSVGMILSYSLVVANVGTLHRMRYGFMMIIVAIGIAAVQKIITERKSLCRDDKLIERQDEN